MRLLPRSSSVIFVTWPMLDGIVPLMRLLLRLSSPRIAVSRPISEGKVPLSALLYSCSPAAVAASLPTWVGRVPVRALPYRKMEPRLPSLLQASPCQLSVLPAHGAPLSQPSLSVQPGPSVASYSATRACRVDKLSDGGGGGETGGKAGDVQLTSRYAAQTDERAGKGHAKTFRSVEAQLYAG